MTDTDGATTHATAGVTVDNRNPTAVSVSVTPAEARVGYTLTCLMTATDADADPLEMRYAWPDGAVGETYTIAETDDPGDTILCTAMAEDPHGGSVEATAATTVRNTAPIIDSVVIRPDPATNDDTLVCAATATDADGDAPTITHAWAGGSAGSLGTGATLDLSTTAAASLETVTCTATASDPDGGSAADTADLTLSNRDPSVSVVLSPATGAARGDTLTCTATATDADGDATTTHFGWTVDGGTTASTTDSATDSTLSGAFSKNEPVACTATSDDGKGGTATASAATTIVNTPPTAPAVAIDPSDPVVGEPLVCMVSTPSTDVDGDGISYTMTWTVDGAAFGAAADTGDTGLGDDLLDTTTWTGDTVPTGVTLDGEVWACTATPDDGDDEGATGTDSVTVEEPVCWSRTYSASLASSPSGITSVNGAWGGHAYVSMGGRGCLRQNSDWNYSYIPVARSSLDFERIEIDVYYPGTGSTSYTMYAFGERYGLNYVTNSLWFSQGTGSADIRHGNTYSANTTLHTFGSPPAPTGTWATLTWVVDRVASTADFYVNGALQASGMAFSPAVLGSSKVVLRAGGVAYRVPPDVCWSNLEVFEAEEDTTCFE